MFWVEPLLNEEILVLEGKMLFLLPSLHESLYSPYEFTNSSPSQTGEPSYELLMGV